MHGPTLARLILAASILGAGGAAPTTPLAQRITDARRALTDQQPASAIRTLEAALGDPGLTSNAADKQVVLGLLRSSYEAAANQADAAGRSLEADAHRENARILGRNSGGINPSPRPAPAPATPATTQPVAVPPVDPVVEPNSPVAEAPVETIKPLLAMPEALEPASGRSEPAIPPRDEPAADPLPELTPSPAPTPAPIAEPTGPGLDEADAAFNAKKFIEAGRIYGALAAANQLPAERAEHWAYCRSCVVAQRISAKPRTQAEWQTIKAEIEEIRRLAPTNWLGDYIRDYVDTHCGLKQPTKPGKTIVRAASPEEPPIRSARAGRPVAAPPANSNLNPNPIRVDTPLLTEPSGTPGAPVGRWRVRESDNFRIFHANPELAEQVAQVAESVRREGIKRWSGKAPATPWKPRCEIYLFPNAPQYAQLTGQPVDSPGFSTMGMNQGQITSRRVSVRTDHEGMLAAVLPHEITHVILADYFTDEQIPRWADEGMAVLMEPALEQKRRANDLVDPLGKNLLFPIDTLMKMDYPDEQYWNLYYAQSVSLTRFLVEQGTPAQFIKFLQGAQTRGFEAELQRAYKINGFADLQTRWVTYARAHAEGNPPMATASAESQPTRRQR